MKHRYVSLLRWKRGEQTALHCVTDPTRHGLMPLIMLETEQYKERKAGAKTEARTAAEAFCNDAKPILGAHPFMLYAAGLGGTEGPHPLLAIARSAQENNLALIPTLRLDDPQNYLDAAKTVSERHWWRRPACRPAGNDFSRLVGGLVAVPTFINRPRCRSG